jgi:hypothetical protein
MQAPNVGTLKAMINRSPFPAMPMRDSGGSFILDNPDDGTPIREMLALKECLLLVTDKRIYEVQLADQIDPHERTQTYPTTFGESYSTMALSQNSFARSCCRRRSYSNKIFCRSIRRERWN